MSYITIALVLLLITGVVIMGLVRDIAQICNTHQLWKGGIEKYLDSLDVIGMCLVGVSMLGILLSIF